MLNQHPRALLSLRRKRVEQRAPHLVTHRLRGRVAGAPTAALATAALRLAIGAREHLAKDVL